MSLLVRPAGDGDIDGVVALLHAHMNPKIPPERWRRILDYPWRPKEAERGWLAEDRGRIVGFMATVYSDRSTRRGLRRFCDLGSWYLLRDYRGTGIGDELLQAGMARAGVTYSTMTARAATGRKIRALGFEILDDTRRLFRPGAPAESPRLRIQTAAGELESLLDPVSAEIFRLHRDLDVRHAFASAPEGGSYLVWQAKLKGEGVLYHELLHAGDLAFLRAHAQVLADLIVPPGTGVLAVDARFLAGAGGDAGTAERIPLARWFRSRDVAPAEIDHLFSETVLLDLKLP